MQYDNKYDIDHNDCPEYENASPEEFASDFTVETDSYDGNDFVDIPDEYDSNEQAATDDGKYNIESAVDNCGCNHKHKQNGNNGGNSHKNGGCGCGNDGCDIRRDDTVNPSDEQAATRDFCYNGTAQERCQLDDYEIISDVLGSEKQIVKLYSTALCETAEENLRDVIRENFTEAAADQYKTFEYMSSHGMYKTEQATDQNITEAKQQFCSICDPCK